MEGADVSEVPPLIVEEVVEPFHVIGRDPHVRQTRSLISSQARLMSMSRFSASFTARWANC